MQSDLLIQMEGLKKIFFTEEIETHALSSIHLAVARGEFVSIAGPSGCGKSTLLAIMGLLDTPTEGNYLLNGTAVDDLGLSRAGQDPQPGSRVHFPEFQPHR